MKIFPWKTFFKDLDFLRKKFSPQMTTHPMLIRSNWTQNIRFRFQGSKVESETTRFFLPQGCKDARMHQYFCIRPGQQIMNWHPARVFWSTPHLLLPSYLIYLWLQSVAMMDKYQLWQFGGALARYKKWQHCMEEKWQPLIWMLCQFGRKVVECKIWGFGSGTGLEQLP